MSEDNKFTWNTPTHKSFKSSTGSSISQGMQWSTNPTGKPDPTAIYDQIKAILDSNIFRVNESIASIELKVNEINDEIKEQKKKMDEQESRIKEQANKNFEILGLFSAIIALIIIDVNIVKSANDFLSAILLIVSLTCSLIIFASVIHSFIARPNHITFGKSFYIPVIILASLIIIGVFFNSKIELNLSVREKIDMKTTQENTTSQSQSSVKN